MYVQESIASTADTDLLTEVPGFGSARREGLLLPVGLSPLWLPDGLEEVDDEAVSCIEEGTETDGDGSFSVAESPLASSGQLLQISNVDMSSLEQT